MITKTMRKNAKQAIENGKLIKPLTKENFETTDQFATYKLLVDNFHGYIYRKACDGKAPKGASITSYAKAICNELGITGTDMDKVVDKLTKTQTIACGVNRREMTPESKTEMRKFNDAIKAIECKEISGKYTYSMQQADIEKKIKERDTWKTEQAKYTTPLFFQKGATAFRLALESVISYTLIDADNTIAETFKDSKQRADTKAWLRWIDKAIALKIDVEPFKKNVDLDGLKTAVNIAYEKHNNEVLNRAIADADK